MILENFDLLQPHSGVELRAFDRRWDLHNDFDFVDLRFDAERDELLLSWRSNAYTRDPGVCGCGLRFRGVTMLEVSARDEGYPAAASSCLERIDKVIPGEREYPHRERWLPDQPFAIEIAFQDERRVRIASKSAAFELTR